MSSDGPMRFQRFSMNTYCLAYQEEYGIPVTILRFFGGYGPRQNTTWWGGPQSVFIHAALTDQPMEIHGDGLQTRSFTYIDDTVDGIIRALFAEKASRRNLQSGKHQGSDNLRILHDWFGN